MHKEFFGEYWTIVIKLNSQLLFIIADKQDLIDLKEFILIELGDPDLNKPITITFEKVKLFQTVFNNSISKDDEALYVI